MNDSSIVQLHRTLVDAIRRSRTGALDRPVTVAEIYQDLVPYRTARSSGFEMNADYEYALLRLLAGEGDLARIEPREVRDKLRMELESANPDVGLFRHYAACDVWINLGDAQEDPQPELRLDIDQMLSWEEEFVGPDTTRQPHTPARDAPAEPASEELAQTPEPLDSPADEQAEPRPRFEIASAPPEAAPAAEAAEEDGGGDCVFCGGELPSGRMVSFCPYCGSDQSQSPCPACGELLEPLWRFCVSCGARVRPLEDHVN